MRTTTRIAAVLLAVVALGACGDSGDDGGTAAPSSSAAPAGSAAGSATPGESARGLEYEPLPAVPSGGEAQCREDGSTIEMAACQADRLRTLQDEIDTEQQAKFDAADEAQQQVILDENEAFVADRQSTCAAEPTSGGTIDRLTAGQCFIEQTESFLERVRS